LRQLEICCDCFDEEDLFLFFYKTNKTYLSKTVSNFFLIKMSENPFGKFTGFGQGPFSNKRSQPEPDSEPEPDRFAPPKDKHWSQLQALEEAGACVYAQIKTSSPDTSARGYFMFIPAQGPKTNIQKYVHSLIGTKNKEMPPVIVFYNDTDGQRKTVNDDLSVIVGKKNVEIYICDVSGQIDQKALSAFGPPPGFVNIGVFDSEKGRYHLSDYLTSGGQNNPFASGASFEVPGSKFYSRPAVYSPSEFITAEMMQALREQADREYAKVPPGFSQEEDLKIKLPLVDCGIPLEVAWKLANLLTVTNDKASIDRIILRRTSAVGKFIDWHVDEAKATLQLALNSDTDYEGGRLVYIVNGQPYTPTRPAGTVTVHGDDVVHGVSTLKSGVRYGLYFLSN
jgi:hypothetical protein